jgi:hypothetical protein
MKSPSPSNKRRNNEYRIHLDFLNYLKLNVTTCKDTEWIEINEILNLRIVVFILQNIISFRLNQAVSTLLSIFQDRYPICGAIQISIYFTHNGGKIVKGKHEDS